MYFNNCKSLQDIKELYRKLAMQHHPDKGGNLEVMQRINREYAEAIRNAAKGGNFTAQETEEEILQSEAYREAINKVINLEGCNIELIGCWLWITGNTKPHAAILKSEPFRFIWAKKKTDFSAWFFRTAENKTTNKGQKMELEAIRTKYGSQTIKSTQSFQLA